MEDRGWERYGAIAGALGVACYVVGFLLPGSPPKTEDSVGTIATFFTENRLKILGEVFLVAFASFLLLVFLAALVSRIRRADGGLGALSLITLVGGVALVGITVFGAATYGALAFQVALAPSAAAVRRTSTGTTRLGRASARAHTRLTTQGINLACSGILER